jgi:transposase
VHLAMPTLGYSRRLPLRGFRSETQNPWREALEEGVRPWGGAPQEVLMDNLLDAGGPVFVSPEGALHLKNC